MQGMRVDTTGQDLARGRDGGIVGTRQAGDRIQQNNHVTLVFDQALGLFDDHFGDLHVTACGFVKSRRNHFALDHALHLGHFFRTLVDQQHDQVAIRVITGNALRNVLQHQGLTGFRRRYDQTALALYRSATPGRRYAR